MGNRKWIAGIVTAVLMGMAAGCSSRPAVEESVQTSAERTEAPSAEEQIVKPTAPSPSEIEPFPGAEKETKAEPLEGGKRIVVMTDIHYLAESLTDGGDMFQSMVEHGVDKIVFSSTAATYGEPERVPILEDDKTVPTNCYGQTKLAMEHMMGWVSKAHGLRYVALRYFNACGAHPSGAIGEAHNPETHLIPIILQVPLGQREAVSIFGDDYPTKDGTCIRDYIHVTDLAQAHILALDYLLNGGDNNVFNLGNGVGFTVKEVVDVARAVTGHPIPAKTAPRRAGDPAQLIASSEKAIQVLGWKPKYNDLNTIVASAWAWHKSHPHGFEEG